MKMPINEIIENLWLGNESAAKNINDLTYELGVSRTHLNRIFYELFNMSPHDYLLNSKMEYAAQLLEYTDYSVKEISSLTGYTSPSRFSNNFKETYKVTPYEYKKKK